MSTKGGARIPPSFLILIYESAFAIGAGVFLLLFPPDLSGRAGEYVGLTVILAGGYLVIYRPQRGAYFFCFVFPLILAAVLVFGMKAIFPVFVARFLSTFLFCLRNSRFSFWFPLFNASQDTLVTAFAVFTLSATRGSGYPFSVICVVGSLWLGWTAILLVHSFLSKKISREEFRFILTSSLFETALSPLGVLLALSYVRIGPGSVLLILIPIVAGFLIFRFALRTGEEKGELGTLYDLTGRLNGNLKLTEILLFILQKSREILSGQRSAIFLFSRDRSGQLFSVPDTSFFSETSFVEEPLCRCLQGESLLIPDHPGLKGFLVAVPLEAGNRILGTLVVQKDPIGQFHEEDKQFLAIMAGHAARAIVNAELFSETLEAHGKLEEAHKQLKEAQAQVVQSGKLAAVGQLAAGVAHEINNPLAAILINVQGLKRDFTGSDSRLERALEDVATGAKRCKAIVERLLKFSRLSVEMKVAFSVRDAIKDALDLLANQLALEKITLDQQVDGDPHMMGNPLEFSQIVTNLVLNSRDAICEKRERNPDIPGHIEVSLERQNGVILRITDNGAGVAAEALPRIFEPFYTTKPVGKGVGLGLSLAHRAVEEMKGKISATSIPEQGATFTLWFPEAPQDTGGPPLQGEAPLNEEENAGIRALEFLKEARGRLNSSGSSKA